MGNLRGGTTIGGYTALHSGLKEAYLSGNLTTAGTIQSTNATSFKIPAGGEIWSGYGNTFFIKDHANGNISLSANGNQLYLGYQNTVSVRLSSNLVATNGTTTILDTAGKLYYQGNDTDSRYVNATGDTMTGTLSLNPGGTNNGAIELGSTGGASTPFIDFHSGATSVDYDTRLIASGGNGTLGGGTLTFNGAKFDFSGAAIVGTGSFNMSGGGYFAVINPNNVNASVSLSWLNDIARLRYGGSGAGSAGGFQIHGTGDAVKFSVDNNGNGLFAGGLSLTGAITFDDSVERYIRGTSLNAGLFMNKDAIGFYDWKNNRGVMSYGQVSNALSIVPQTYIYGDVSIHDGDTGHQQNSLRVGQYHIGSIGQKMIMKDVTEIRFGSDGSWDYNNWAGIKFDTSTRDLWIGGPTSAQFTSNASPANIDVIFDGINQLQSNATVNVYNSAYGYSIGIGRTAYYAGTLSGGDSIYSSNWMHLGGASGVRLWSANTSSGGIFMNIGASGSAPTIFGIKNTERVWAQPLYNRSGKPEEVKTFYDSSDGDESGYTSISTAGWYTIAYNGTTTTPGTNSGGSRAYGKFTVMDISSGHHQLVQFTAGTAYNRSDGANIVLLGNVKYDTTNEVIGGIRILTGNTYDTQYLQVYLAAGLSVRFIMEDNYWDTGWIPLDFNGTTPGSGIPTGYVDNKLEMQGGFQNRPQNLLSGSAAPPSQGSYVGDVYIQF